MELFTDPPPYTYLLWQKFKKPTDTPDGISCIAVTQTSGVYISAFYTVLIMAMFSAIWKFLISMIILFLAPDPSTPGFNRTIGIAIVAAWNAQVPVRAAILMIPHAGRVLWGTMRKRCKDEFNWRSVFFCAAIVVAALGTIAGSITLSIFFPKLLIIGKVAPVDPSIVFYPNMDDSLPSSTLANDTNALNSQLMKLDYSSHGALRALSRIDNFDTTVRPRVRLRKIKRERFVNARDKSSEQRYGIRYRYNVTGVDMGLQDAGELMLSVNGTCEFQDSWFNMTTGGNNGTEIQYDEWNLWANAETGPFAGPNLQLNRTYYKSRNPYRIRDDAGIVPYAAFYPAVLEPANLASKTGYNYYAILPYTTLNKSPVNGDDPWYAVQPITTPGHHTAGLNFEVKLGRPPLACMQYDELSYRNWVGHLADLASSDRPPGLKLSNATLTVLLQELSAPMVVNLGLSISAFTLKSATALLQSSGDPGINTLDATAYSDMERLILASYVATRDIFRDTAIAGVDGTGEGRSAQFNLFTGDDGRPEDGAGDFVLSSSRVSTLRVRSLVVVPVVLVVLLIFNGIIALFTRTGEIAPNPGWFDQYALILASLQATQLYRIIDQMLDDQGKGTTLNYTWREQTGQLPGVISSKDKLSPTGAARPAVIRLPSGHLRLTLAKVDPNLDQAAAEEARWKTLRKQEPKEWMVLPPIDEEKRVRQDAQGMLVNVPQTPVGTPRPDIEVTAEPKE